MRSQRPKCDVGVNAAVWRMAVSGLCAGLVGIGLSRFAYTPVLPELIAAHWFKPSQAIYLGAANLAGYLAGALLAQAVASRGSGIATLRTMMLVASAAFFACSAPLRFFWFFLWRFASGVAGGALMALVAPTDFVARGLGRGLAAGAQDWVLFGLGALGGPLLAGAIADRLGLRVTLRLAFVVQAAAVSILAVYTDPVSLTVSSLVPLFQALCRSCWGACMSSCRETPPGRKLHGVCAPSRSPSARPLAATASPTFSRGREVATASFLCSVQLHFFCAARSRSRWRR